MINDQAKGGFKGRDIFTVVERARRDAMEEKWTKINRVDGKDTARHARNSFDFPFTGPIRTSGTSGRRCIKDSSDIGNRSKLLSLRPTPLRIYHRSRFYDFPPNFDLLFSPFDPDHVHHPIPVPRPYFYFSYFPDATAKLLPPMTVHVTRFNFTLETRDKYARNKF